MLWGCFGIALGLLRGCTQLSRSEYAVHFACLKLGVMTLPPVYSFRRLIVGSLE